MILRFSRYACVEHLKCAKAREYWGFGLLRCARNDGKKPFENEKLAEREGLLGASMRLALRVRAMRSCKIAPGNFVDPLLGFSSHCNKKPTITPKSKAAVLFLLTLVWLWVIRRERDYSAHPCASPCGFALCAHAKLLLAILPTLCSGSHPTATKNPQPHQNQKPLCFSF